MNIQIPPVVKNLLIINILLFVVSWLCREMGYVDLRGPLGVYYFDAPNFRIWQPITFMFMHVNLMHILFNMFALYTFGSVLEAHWGAKRFLNFYFITGLGAYLLQLLVQLVEVYHITGSVANPELINASASALTKFSEAQLGTLADIYTSPMMGASGAVFGLLVAFAMMYPEVELYIMFIPVPIKAKYIVPAYIVLELFLGVAQFSGDSVAHYAHLGGALFGYILVKLWKNKNTFYDYYE